MGQRINRRDLIVEKAIELFVGQGYKATSIRQIADAAECTEAAIYYHFKDGKRELLQVVVECELPDLLSGIEACKDSKSLGEVILRLGNFFAQHGRDRMNRIRWFISEFPNLNEDERALFHNKQLTFHSALASVIEPLVKHKHKVSGTAWILMFAMFGYGNSFWNMEMEKIFYFPPEQFINDLIELFDTGA